MLAFTQRLIALRRAHPVFRRTTFLIGEDGRSGLPDVWWFRPDGRSMSRRDWEGAVGSRLGVFLNGAELRTRTAHGEPMLDDSFLVLFNADADPVDFTLPPRRFGARWALELSTDDPRAPAQSFLTREVVRLEGRSVLLLRRE